MTTSEQPAHGIRSGFSRTRGFFGIRARTALFTWLVSIAAITIFMVKVIPQQKEFHLNALRSKALVLETSIHDIAAGSIVTEDYSEVVDHCMEILQSNPSVSYLILTRNDGFSLIHLRNGWRTDSLDGRWRDGFGSRNGQILHTELIDDAVFHMDHVFEYSGLNWGRLHVGLSLDEYHAGVHAVFKQTALVALICVSVGLLGSLLFANRLVKPLLTLEATVQRVASGNLDIRADIHSGDEVETLALAFNHMTQSIQDREAQVRTQNNALAALATEKTLHSGDFYEAARLIAETSARILNTARTSIWLLADGATQLECITLYSLDNQHHSQHSALPRSGCEPYFDALQTSRVLAVSHVDKDPRIACLAKRYLRPAGITGLLDAVIRIDGAVAGVVCHDHIGETRTWSAEEENFAGSIADLMALALEARERRRAQEELLAAKNAAEAASESKSRFLATMSHEIRTPLNGVIGMLKLLYGTGLNAKQERFVEKGVLSSETLLNVINDILDFSKIEAGRLELEHVRFNLIDTIENVVQMFAESAELQGIELACRISSSVPRQAIGDPNRLGQILINLVGNAHKFTQRGEIVVEALTREETALQTEIEFKVRDTGKGISLEDKKRIFEPFLQEDNSTTRQFGGTGLGLGISRQLVGLMGGSIWVDSTPGHGSTFSFTVRLGSTPAAHVLPKKLNTMRGMRALVVDDHSITCDIIACELNSWGCSCRTVNNGDTALALIREQAADGRPYDFVIADWNMPGMNGETLCRQIKADPSIAQLPVILLSSVVGLHPDRLQEIGIAAWVAKPARQSELYDAILNIINHTAPVVPAAAARPAQHPQAKDIRILLAEDNEINQEVAIEILKQHGYACDIACNGREAAEAAVRSRYDLILMDCMMPEMDGYDATRTIRTAEEGSGRRCPIIALTANAMKGDREACLEAGMDDYLSKPLDPYELIAMISKWYTDTEVEDQPAFRPEREAAAGPALFDRTAVLRRCMGNEPMVERLIASFLQQTDNDIRTLADALQAEDTKTLYMTAHRIKGAAANLAMEPLRKRAEALEKQGFEKNLKKAAERLAELSTAFERMQQYFGQADSRSAPPEARP